MTRALSIVLLVVASAATPALAQEASPKSKCVSSAKAAEGGDGKAKYKVVKKGGKTVYVLTDDFVICGKVPHPDVFYGLLNSTINYEWENLHQDFMPRILRSVEGNPF